MRDTPTIHRPAGKFRDALIHLSVDTSGIRACVQCGRCTSACTAGFLASETPRQVVRHLQWNELEAAVGSSFLYQCKQCIGCTVQCPQGVDVAGVVQALMKARFLTLETK